MARTKLEMMRTPRSDQSRRSSCAPGVSGGLRVRTSETPVAAAILFDRFF
jgi:hypothetical protein